MLRSVSLYIPLGLRKTEDLDSITDSITDSFSFRYLGNQLDPSFREAGPRDGPGIFLFFCSHRDFKSSTSSRACSWTNKNDPSRPPRSEKRALTTQVTLHNLMSTKHQNRKAPSGEGAPEHNLDQWDCAPMTSELNQSSVNVFHGLGKRERGTRKPLLNESIARSAIKIL
ncbi:uncharacterized protein BJX67DRAFT_109487 [Aspergillus lucknowensis]|uniref:Uncharacterized protein n=1 Tax=Aspergillus lucknowensis TaxID=176173 RepID=A0ABR4LR18_9EURO